MSTAKCDVPPVPSRRDYKSIEMFECDSDDEAEPYIQPLNCSDDGDDYLKPIVRAPERLKAKMPTSSDKFDARQVPPVPNDSIPPPLPQRKTRMVHSVVRMPAAPPPPPVTPVPPPPVTAVPPPPVTPVSPPPRTTPVSEPRNPAPPPSPPSHITPPPPREPKPKQSVTTDIQRPPRKPSFEEPISTVHPKRELPAAPQTVSPTIRNPVAIETSYPAPPPLPPSRITTSPQPTRPSEIQNGSEDPAAPLPPRKPHLVFATQTHIPSKSQEKELVPKSRVADNSSLPSETNSHHPKPTKPIIFVKKLDPTSLVTSEAPVTSPQSTRPARPLPSTPPVTPTNDRIKTPLPPIPHDKEKEDLYYYDWYFSDVNREKSQKMIMDEHVDGVFMVRNSTHKGNPYTLCLYYENRHWNLHIRRRPDQKYSLGVEKPNEKTFRNVPEIIEYYKNKPIDLVGSSTGKALLTRAPAKGSFD